MQRFSTRCVHSGTIKDTEAKGINTPIYTSTSYEFIDRPDTVYPRYLNTPNLRAVADKIASLEQTESALVLSSGMAAISTVLFSFLSQGDHVVFQKGLYGGTTHFMERELTRFGICFSVAASQEVDDIAACINPKTKLVYIESPSNPLLNITDIGTVADLCSRAGVLSVIDNTFASPVNQQPSNLGVDIVVHSATKYLGGHSDIQAGAVATRKELMGQILETGLNFGGSLNANTLYLLERSMKTLHLRMERINDNALEIAHYLTTHSQVTRVNYPGLAEHPQHELAARQMQGYGGMMSFEVKGGDSLAFQKRLELVKPSMSLGGLETICSSPAHTSHRHLGAEGRRSEGIAEGLIRLSVGIEDTEDLKADLDQALGGS